MNGTRKTSAVVVLCLLNFSGRSNVVALRKRKTKKPKPKPEGRVQKIKKDETYGVDVSFPAHYLEVSENYAWLPHNVDPEKNPTPPEYKDSVVQPLGNRKQVYEDFMKGCREWYKEEAEYCDIMDVDRVQSSVRQAAAMRNFTDNGFMKTRAPNSLFKTLKRFWETHKAESYDEEDNVYFNFWKSMPKYLDFEEEHLQDEADSATARKQILEAILPVAQDWVGSRLYPMLERGIRAHTNGCIEAPHVEILPAIVTAVINLVNDVNEEWPYELIGHDGIAYNVTMEPGDMVLYESHSTFHGHPFAMNGNNHVNYYIHFESTGLDLAGQPLPIEQEGAPVYVASGSWIVDEEGGWNLVDDKFEGYELETNAKGATMAHHAAHSGDLGAIKQMIEENSEDTVHQRDENGWSPIHEAVRAGHKEVVEYLLQNGADINQRTQIDETGGSPLWWAMMEHQGDHPVIDYLRSMGAVVIEPEL